MTDRETLERAEKMLDDLCNGRQRWRMSIPAQPETDPDLVIGRGLAVNRSLLERLEAAEANYKFMVDRAAGEHLEGYRELGERAAKLEEDNERLRAAATVNLNDDRLLEVAVLNLNEANYQKARIEAALILLPEQPEAAMNALRGEGVSDGSG